MSNKKIFSRQPYEKPNSYQLIKAVKAGDARTVKKLLETNRYLVFDYDHVILKENRARYRLIFTMN